MERVRFRKWSGDFGSRTELGAIDIMLNGRCFFAGALNFLSNTGLSSEGGLEGPRESSRETTKLFHLGFPA
jgi:hypothetical protein